MCTTLCAPCSTLHRTFLKLCHSQYTIENKTTALCQQKLLRRKLAYCDQIGLTNVTLPRYQIANSVIDRNKCQTPAHWNKNQEFFFVSMSHRLTDSFEWNSDFTHTPLMWVNQRYDFCLIRFFLKIVSSLRFLPAYILYAQFPASNRLTKKNNM